MAWTQTDLDAIEDALKRCVKRVKFADKEVEYASIDDMRKVRDMIRKSLGLTRKSRRFYAKTDKGLDTDG